MEKILTMSEKEFHQALHEDRLVFEGEITINGSLNFCYWFPNDRLPNDLKVNGSLDLSFTHIASLPRGLKVNGSLNLRGTDIESLPDDLEVGGDLDLSYTPIESLPDNIKVKGEIIMEGVCFAMNIERNAKVREMRTERCEAFGIDPVFKNMLDVMLG